MQRLMVLALAVTSGTTSVFAPASRTLAAPVHDVPLLGAVVDDYARVSRGDLPGRARDLDAVRAAVSFPVEPLRAQNLRLLAAWTTDVRGEPAADGIAADREAARIDAEILRLPGDPAGRRMGVLDCRGKFVLGGEAISDRHDPAGAGVCEHAAETIVARDAAEDADEQTKPAEAQLGRIDRHRPNPAELKQNHRCGADDIEMVDRIDCQSSVGLRSAVAQPAREPRKHEAVDRSDENARHRTNEKLVK